MHGVLYHCLNKGCDTAAFTAVSTSNNLSEHSLSSARHATLENDTSLGDHHY